MAMTSYPASNYNFHEETLHDVVPEVTNSTTRTLLHNELVYLGGFFGEVADYDGILTTAVGNININSERRIRTSQVKAGLDPSVFVVGAVAYFVPQTNSIAGFITNVYEATAVPVGIITDSDATSTWVEFRPYVQTIDLSMVRDARGVVAGLALATADVADAVALNPVKIVQLTVPTGSEAGLTFDNVDTGLAVGDSIVDIIVKGTATNASGTMTLSHGGGGADISDAIACITANAITRAGSIASGVVTADGLTVTPNATGDAGIVTIMYIPA